MENQIIKTNGLPLFDNPPPPPPRRPKDVTAKVQFNPNVLTAEEYEKIIEDSLSSVAKKHGLGNTLVTGHKKQYFVEAMCMAICTAIVDSNLKIYFNETP